MEGGFSEMKNFTFRTMLTSMVLAMFLVPLYAHHGNQFLSKAMESNTFEVRLGEMAGNKTQNNQVKEFAQMIIRDHTQAIDQMKKLRDARMADSVSSKGQVDTKTTKNTPDVQLTPEHQRTLDKLASLSGADFDREFMDMMVRDHRENIRDFEAHSRAHGNVISSNPQKSTGAGQATTRNKPAAADPKNYSHSELNRDLDTAEFAASMLPTLRQHLDQAEAIQRELQQTK
jgi:predicted outer membrane protein